MHRRSPAHRGRVVAAAGRIVAGAPCATRAAAALIFVAASLPAPARAAPPATAPATAPATTAGGGEGKKSAKTLLEPFEEQLVRRAMERHGVVPDPAPEGKVIGRIIVDREEVLGKGDYYFDFIRAFNVFHTLTRESTVRRELLFAEGARYEKAEVEESERKLRNLIIFSTVRFVAFRMEEPGQVGILVVTKDLWSLRTNFYVVYNAGTLEYFETNPSENNLFGRYKILTGHIQFDLGKFSFGEGFFEPRLFGTTVQFYEDLWVEFERHSGKPEGVRGEALVSKPLFSLSTEYAIAAEAAFDHGVDRIFEGAHYQLFGAERFGVGLPILYRRDRLAFASSLTRSLGFDVKHNVSLKVGYWLDRARLPVAFPAPDGVLRDPPDGLVSAFRDEVLPVGEEYLYALLEYATKRSRWAKLMNLHSLGTTEDYRVGHSLVADLLFGAALDGTPDFVQPQIAAAYGIWLGDDLLQLGLFARSRLLSRDGAYESLYRLEPVNDAGVIRRVSDDTLTRFVNNALDLEVRNAFPRFLYGRLHARLMFGVRDRDLDRSRFCVGGGYPNLPVIGHGDLRGFRTNRFCGTHRLVGNVEWRSLPLNVFSLQVGAALFADVAMTWGRPERFVGTDPLAASVGAGLRFQFPQLDREAFRVDVAFPVAGRVPGFDPAVVITVVFLQIWDSLPPATAYRTVR